MYEHIRMGNAWEPFRPCLGMWLPETMSLQGAFRPKSSAARAVCLGAHHLGTRSQDPKQTALGAQDPAFNGPVHQSYVLIDLERQIL